LVVTWLHGVREGGRWFELSVCSSWCDRYLICYRRFIRSDRYHAAPGPSQFVFCCLTCPFHMASCRSTARKSRSRFYLAIPMTPVPSISPYSSSLISDTYRKPVSHQHSQSASTARGFPGRDHRCRRGRQWFAVGNPSAFPFQSQACVPEGVFHTPRTLSGPISLMSLSVTVVFTLPWPSVSKLPKSPTWRSWSSGAPCVLLNGLTGWSRRISHQPSAINLRGVTE